MYCLSCRYHLSQLTGPPHRCPECGREFDPNDPKTFYRFVIYEHNLPDCLSVVASLAVGGLIAALSIMVMEERWGPVTHFDAVGGLILFLAMMAVIWLRSRS